jgi:Ca2+-dependent lipid-binding protein
LPTDEDKNERGKILLSLCYSKARRNFHVKIVRGSQLLPMDFGQTSDPYCKLVLLPTNDSNNKWSFKTTVKKHTLQPEFHEEFIFPHINVQDLVNKTLQVTVFDKDMGKKDDYIGEYSTN